MTDEQRAEIIAYRMSRAHQALAEATLLSKNELFNTAINRVYYSCFYAVSALLLQQKIEVRTHAGVKKLFGLHFVKAGHVSAGHAHFYAEIFSKRQTGDYEDCISFELGDVAPRLKWAAEFITEIEKLLSR